MGELISFNGTKVGGDITVGGVSRGSFVSVNGVSDEALQAMIAEQLTQAVETLFAVYADDNAQLSTAELKTISRFVRFVKTSVRAGV